MKEKNLIPVEDFCLHHSVEIQFIQSLNESGLVQLIVVEERQFLEEELLPDLERFARLHYELDINIEGIEAVNNLLQKMEALHTQIQSLQNRLKLYE